MANIFVNSLPFLPDTNILYSQQNTIIISTFYHYDILRKDFTYINTHQSTEASYMQMIPKSRCLPCIKRKTASNCLKTILMPTCLSLSPSLKLRYVVFYMKSLRLMISESIRSFAKKPGKRSCLLPETI